MNFEWSSEKRCLNWLTNASFSNAWALSIPAVIIGVNFGVKLFLKWMSKLEGHKNRPAEVYSAAKYMWFLATLNTAFII